jgi:hypothetical protein
VALPDRSIWHLTDPWGTPRHYPPGQHPANYRDREMLKKLEALDTNDPQVAEAIAYYTERIAAFEESASEHKALDHLRLRESSR